MDEKPQNVVPITSKASRELASFGSTHGLQLLTILFTDLVDSTKLQNDLGNTRAAALIDRHRAIIQDELSKYDAREIEWAGDSCLAVFTKPSDAILFSLRLQARMREARKAEADLPHVRIGAHLGEILVRDHVESEGQPDHLYGLQVSETARVMSIARGDQIFCTRTVFDSARNTLKGLEIEGVGEVAWINHGAYSLKGSDLPVDVCEVGEKGLAPLKPPVANDKCRPVSSPSLLRHGSVALSICLALALGTVLWIQGRPAGQTDNGGLHPSSSTVTRWPLTLSAEFPLDGPFTLDTSLAISPDGTQIAYLTRGPEGSGIAIRRVGELSTRRLAGPYLFGIERLCFSPDGQWVAYVVQDNSGTHIFRVAVTGGTPSVVVDVRQTMPLFWGEDGLIYYNPNVGTGIWSVPAFGGETKEVVKTEEGELGAAFPVLLPGGKGIVYTSYAGSNIDTCQVKIFDISAGTSRVLFDRAIAIRYLTTGHLAFSQKGRLMAVAFDPDTLETRGRPFDVTDEMMGDPEEVPTRIAVSDSGTMIYVPSGTDPSLASTLVWLEPGGQETPTGVGAATYRIGWFSPDGRAALVTVDRGNTVDVWAFDLERQNFRRLTDSGRDWANCWTHDGTQIVFSSQHSGKWGIYIKPVDDPDAPSTLLYESPDDALGATWISPDNSEIIFEYASDIFSLKLDGSGEPHPLVNSRFVERESAVSPDGKWMAYASDESGRFEVYVRSYPDMGLKTQVSVNGGRYPQWGPNGEFYYAEPNPSPRLMKVELTMEPSLSVGASHEFVVFQQGYSARDALVHPDGKRVLTTKSLVDPRQRSSGGQIVVVENWFEELKKLDPLE